VHLEIEQGADTRRAWIAHVRVDQIEGPKEFRQGGWGAQSTRCILTVSLALCQADATQSASTSATPHTDARKEHTTATEMPAAITAYQLRSRAKDQGNGVTACRSALLTARRGIRVQRVALNLRKIPTRSRLLRLSELISLFRGRERRPKPGSHAASPSRAPSRVKTKS
jgi:hypothetical protein